jgi:hypothetical protein
MCHHSCLKYPAYLLRYPLAAKPRKVLKIEIPGSPSRASVANYIAIYVLLVIVEINKVVNFPGKILFKPLGIFVDLLKTIFSNIEFLVFLNLELISSARLS